MAPCPNTEVMVRTGEGDEKRPKCTNMDFDPTSGLGIPERVAGEMTFICDPCGYPKARNEVGIRLRDLASFESRFDTVDFGDLRRQINGADEKLRGYLQVHAKDEHTHLRSRFLDAVAQAYATGRRLFYQIREAAITQLTDQASQLLEDVGHIKADDQAAQDRLDAHRNDALRLISKAREDMESSRQEGIRRPQRSKLLKNGCINALIAMYKTKAYAGRQEEDVNEATIRAEMEGSDKGEETEESVEYTREKLLRMTKPALIALGTSDFNLTLNDEMKKDQMSDLILEGQEKTKATATARS